MGSVVVKTRIRNRADQILLERGFLELDRVREVEVDALVDTGATMLVLPKAVVERLGLPIVRTVRATYADDRSRELGVAGDVEIAIGDRRMLTECVVEENGSRALIGQIVLEAMDLMVDPKGQKLVPHFGSEDMPTLELR